MNVKPAVGLVSLAVAIGGMFAAASVALSSSEPTVERHTTPAGQVEEIVESPTTTTDAPAQVPQDDPVSVDNGPMNTPAEEPANEVPAPGVPYDSDGGAVVPNPQDMAPGEVAPAPPIQDPQPVEPGPAEQPVIPADPDNPDAP